MSGDPRDPALEKTVSAEEAGVTPGGAVADGGRLAARTKLGRYEIVEFIGGGGMGWVYRAKDTELERDVAIKVVQPTVAGPKGRDRLLAEARAMAKLRHRAVVPVHDVGEYAGGVYVAMALVKGGTLHDWMHAEARPWRQVVARFLEAGRGLVAAHAAGIVHRDFKPRNVLLGEAGEVMVADFGIASASADVGDGEGVAGGAREATSIVGTPAYMAPEQAAGQAVDARADQYSFCVSLWEGLHGQRPQEAETRTQGALLERSPAAPKSRRRVPGWLTDAVARGFAPSAEKRWPTLAALLDRLERGLGRRRRRVLAASGVVAVAAVAIAASVVARNGRAAPRRACRPPSERVAVIWNAERATRLITLYAALEPRHGGEIAARTAGALDGFTRRWAAAHVDACRATYVEGRQPEGLLARRYACLDDKLASIGERVRLIEGAATAKDVSSILRMLDRSPRIENCGDLALLASAPPPPEEPAARAEFVSLGKELAAIDALRLAAKLKEHRVRATAALQRARALAHPVLLVSALDQLASALHNDGEYEAEIPLRTEAIASAANARDDWSAADQWVALLWVVGGSLKRLDEATQQLLPAEAAVARAGNPVEFRYELAALRSEFARQRGRHDEAVRWLDEGIALLTAAGAGAVGAQLEQRMFFALGRRAELLRALKRPADAVVAFEQAIRIGVSKYGPEHPFMYSVYGNLAQAQMQVGDHVAALRNIRHAAAIAEATFDPSPRLASVLWGVGETLLGEQQLDEAVPYLERADALARDTMTDRDLRRADIVGSLGAARLASGEVDDAVDLLKESLAIYATGAPTANGALTIHVLGDAYAARREWDEAIASYRQAQRLLGELRGEASAYVAAARVAIAVVAARREQWSVVLRLTREVLATRFDDDASAALARARFWHGAANVALKRDVHAGLAEARGAADSLRADPIVERRQLAEIDAWLDAHRTEN